MRWHSLPDVLVGQTQRRVVDHVDVNFTLTLFQIQSLSLSLSLPPSLTLSLSPSLCLSVRFLFLMIVTASTSFAGRSMTMLTVSLLASKVTGPTQALQHLR